MRTARTGAPPRRLSSDVIFELFLGQLKADEQFEARALHRGAHFGDAQRVDRGVGVARAALAVDALLHIGGQRRGGAVDT